MMRSDVSALLAACCGVCLWVCGCGRGVVMIRGMECECEREGRRKMTEAPEVGGFGGRAL